MQETYRINICGLERDLPVCPLHGNLYIAGFVMFGDVEMTETCAAELLRRCPEHDFVLTAESKGIPLAYEMARQEKGKYLVARKGLKLYMKNPISVEVQSITTARLQTLYIDRADADRMKGRRILIVDDVISTGESLRAMEKLVEAAGGVIVGRAAVLAEGDAAKRDDLVFLQELPLLVDEDAKGEEK